MNSKYITLLSDWGRNFRVLNLCIAGASLVYFHWIISYLYNQTFEHSTAAVTFVTICIMAAGNLINDIYDSEIDLINKAERVWINSENTRKAAIWLYFLLNIVALGVSLYHQLWSPFYLICILLLLVYSKWLKRIWLVGNVAVATFTALSIYQISFYSNSVFQELIFVSILAFGINLIREVVKDIEDIEGDGMNGLKTFPIVFGTHATKKLVFVLTTLLIFYLIGAAIVVSIRFLPSALITAGLLGYLIILLGKATQKDDFTRASSTLKIIMLTGVLSTLFFLVL